MSNNEKRSLKLVFAAFLFINHTRDGMEICKIMKVEPRVLYGWVRSAEWKRALQMWGWEGEEIAPLENPDFYDHISYGICNRGSVRGKKEKLFVQQHGRCAGCREQMAVWHLTVDHIIPKSRLGTSHISNLQLLCHFCNMLKGDMTQGYMRAELIARGIISEEGEQTQFPPISDKQLDVVMEV